MVIEVKTGKLDFLERVGLEDIKDRVVLVDDETFMRLLKRAMVINPHIAINKDTGTVENLWFQEDIPPETILYSIAFTTKELKGELEKVLEGVVHVGGDITTGLGFARVIRIGGGGDGEPH